MQGHDVVPWPCQPWYRPHRLVLHQRPGRWPAALQVRVLGRRCHYSARSAPRGLRSGRPISTWPRLLDVIETDHRWSYVLPET